MQTGISTASLFRRLYNEDALPLFREWGVETTEVFLTSFSEYGEEFARKLLRAKGELSVHSVHVLNTQFEPQLYAAHPRVKADAYYWLDKAMGSARILGAEYYTFHGIARIKRTFKEDLAQTALLTEEIARFCAKYAVTLSYENVEWAFYNRPGIFSELKKGCPALKGVLDIKQARISGYDYRDYLREIGKDLVTVHVSDTDGDGKMCLPGRGTFDFDELYARLRDTGFRGAVLLESYPGDYKEIGELKSSYEFLREKAEKYGL